MPSTGASQITTLLRAWADGDQAALDRLTRKSTPSCTAVRGGT